MDFWQGITGEAAADAANAAAADEYAKKLRAAGETRAAGGDYSNSLNTLSRGYDPYVGAGSSALAQLLNGLGLNGPGGSAAFADAYRATPGYDAGLETGSRAFDRSASARGMLNSGRAFKDLTRFGSDYEDQRSGNYLTRLMGLGTQGLGATQAQVGTQAQGYGGKLSADMAAAGQMFGAAPTVGQGMVAGANAESKGMTNLLGMGMNLAGMGMGGGFGGGMSSFSQLMGGNPSSFAHGSNPFTPYGTTNPAYR